MCMDHSVNQNGLENNLNKKTTTSTVMPQSHFSSRQSVNELKQQYNNTKTHTKLTHTYIIIHKHLLYMHM